MSQAMLTKTLSPFGIVIGAPRVWEGALARRLVAVLGAMACWSALDFTQKPGSGFSVRLIEEDIIEHSVETKWKQRAVS